MTEAEFQRIMTCADPKPAETGTSDASRGEG
jgi:hypothetical protein